MIDVVTAKTYEPRVGFRWVAQFLGIDAFGLSRVESLPDHRLKLSYYWLQDQAEPWEPSQAHEGMIKLLDPTGGVTDVWRVSFERYELLPFDLDYTKQRALAHVVLSGVSYRRITNS